MKCSILSLSPGSVMALTNMVVSQLQNSNNSATKAFDPEANLKSGMARTPPSQVALLLDSESLKAKAEVIIETTVAPTGPSTTIANSAAVLHMQIFITIGNLLIVLW
ncbi:hypothetical protein Ciccas_007011 [Cichlidogyrus casuarinus]|uniref:Uncharacterized protein n=1 Tax=Cichlidogyrus casuarinus TaxID=1844966 RepID=A0ABD2Q447_9PLAT